MTGFGVGEASLDAKVASGGCVTIEVRAVNHRYLDLRVKAPHELPEIAALVETLSRERLTRGRFDISVRVDGVALGAMTLDRDRARSVFHALKALRDELAPNENIPLSILSIIPSLFIKTLEHHPEELRDALSKITFKYPHK